MGTFALDVNSNQQDIISGLNYALANLGTGLGTDGNVLTANLTTGEITTTSTNSGGYSSTTVVSYLYRYMDVKYANTSTGSSGFSGNCTLANYYGLRNTSNTAISSNPADYIWYQVTGGFGTTKALFYQTIGGRQIAFFAGNSAPNQYVPVIDDTPIDLDQVTSVNSNQIVNVNAYFQSNATPATPSGGTYDFTTLALTPPSGWSATIPSFVANTDVYVSSAAFTGNTEQTAAPPATLWTVPAVYTSQFQGNTGPAGERGFVPMGYVITPSDPTGASDATLTSWFSSSRSNASAPIGLGFAPIANDTAQFAYTDLFTGNTVTLVKQYDGANWNSVVGTVISGGLFVPGSINANVLNANEVYSLTITGGSVTPGVPSGSGFWMTANQGDAYLGGNTIIGANLTIGNNAVIGGNLTIQGLVSGSQFNANVVTTTAIAANATSQTVSNVSNQGSTFINYTNGISTPGSWPDNTRGVVAQVNLTPSANTSQILVNFSTYINSTANAASNLVEVWRTGNSNIVLNSFQSVSTLWPSNTWTSNVNAAPVMYSVGSQGQAAISYDGGYTWTASTTNAGTSGFLAALGTQANIAVGNANVTYSTYSFYPRQQTGTYYSGNAGPITAGALSSWGNQFDINTAALVRSQANSVVGMLGSTSGNIFLYDFTAGVPNNYYALIGTPRSIPSNPSGAINGIGFDITAKSSITSRVNVRFIGVGDNGFGISGNLVVNPTPIGSTDVTITGNTIMTSPNGAAFTGTLRSVCSNATTTTRADSWVAVGNVATSGYGVGGIYTVGPASGQPSQWSGAYGGSIANAPTAWTGVAYGNGYWVIVGDNGQIAYATSSTWHGVWTVASTNPALSNGYPLYSVTYNPASNQFVAVGNGTIMSASGSAPGTWTQVYTGAQRQVGLTRLAYYGSWLDPYRTDVPLSTQQVTNGTVVSGTAVDDSHTAGTAYTYYVVAGNLSKLQSNTGGFIYVSNPGVTVTEYKR